MIRRAYKDFIAHPTLDTKATEAREAEPIDRMKAPRAGALAVVYSRSTTR